jgi:hypothetical protein
MAIEDLATLSPPASFWSAVMGSDSFNIAAIRLHICQDFKNYLRYAILRDGFQPEEFQMILAELLQGDRPEWIRRKKVCLGFRGCSKTYILRRYVEWRIQRRPETQVVVHSSNDELASQFTDSVRRTITDDPIFDHLGISRGGTFAFSLAGHEPEKGHTIRCAGIKTAITGQRAHLYVFDDPEPDVEPEALYERILAAFEEADFILHPIEQLWMKHDQVPIPEQTNYIVIGQPHWTGTAYIPPEPDPVTGQISGHNLRDALFVKIPAIRRVPIGTNGAVEHESGEYAEISMMPNRFNTNRLLGMRDKRSISPQRWRLQMEIDTSPLEGEMSVIPVSKLTKINRLRQDIYNLTAVVDPADSTSGCEWAVAIGGICGNMIHVVDLAGFQAEVYSYEMGELAGITAWKRIFDLCEAMTVNRIYLEKNLKSARIACMRCISQSNLRAQVFEYSASVNKLRRITESLGPPTNSGMISFEPHVLMDRANVRQLTELKYTTLPRPDDRLDALAGLISVLMERPSVTAGGPIAQVPKIGEHRLPTYRRIGTGQAPFQRVGKRRR